MPHNDFSDRKGVPEGQNDDQLGPSHEGQPRAIILAIYGRAACDRANDKNSTIYDRLCDCRIFSILTTLVVDFDLPNRRDVLHLKIERPSNIQYKPG
jgi:hypothetical protein